MGSSSHMKVIQRPLVFALNGKRVELQHVDPTMTLLTYLRTQTELKGTKLGCGEGGCGACVVLLSKYDLKTKKVEEFTINSCLVLLCSVDRSAITTIEGLGNSRDGLHAIQKRFAGFHASQCGFCTPGMCISIYGALRKHQGSCSDGSVINSKRFKAVDLENSVRGNICRCTGYRPISDVCKSFADDVDVEDLGLNTYWSSKEKADRNLLPAYDPKDDPQFPDFIIKELEQEKAVNGLENSTLLLSSQNMKQQWVRPSSLQEVFSRLENYQEKQQEVKIVVGNTSSGIYKKSNPQFFIDIGHIPDLLVEEQSEQGIEVGAAVRISRLIDILESYSSNKETNAESVHQTLAKHLKKVATSHVRNSASVGGNLIMAQKLGFDSDVATLFLGVGASVKLISNTKQEILQSMDEFLEDPLDDKTVLKSILIPSLKHGTNMKFESYRASPRPSGNAVAYVNAAFLVHLSKGERRVEESRLAFGAFGERHAVRAIELEKFLKGKVVTLEVILKATRIVKTSVVVPRKGTRKASYRSALAVSFLFKFLESLTERHTANGTISNGEIPNGNLHPSSSISLMSGKQRLQTPDQGPLGKPSPKVMGELQASGEAVFVDDIPSPPNSLHAAFVYSGKALARIKAMKLEHAMSSPGAVSFVTIQDIPSNGKNIGIMSDLAKEALFASDTVQCIGQPLGLLVADTLRNAKAAAGKIDVEYDTESLGPPVLTIEDAVAKNSFFETSPLVKPLMLTKHGDVSQELAKAEHKIQCAELRTGSQYFFYMEPQTALAMPDEDNCLVVYSSCQAPEFVQTSVAMCLGLPMHNVRVITRRVGGGFGGKAAKACTVATACALAAYKLQRPVRLTLDRNTDMIMMGGRHATKTIYNAGFDSHGKIRALQAQVFLQGGWSEDMSPILPLMISSSLKKFNWSSFDFDFKICKTNVPSRTAMRGPGETQGSFIADTIIEHIAVILNLSSDVVMERNMHTVESAEAVYGPTAVGGSTGFTLPMIWQRLRETADVENRLKEIENYNSSSLWNKRGLATSQCSYVVMFTPKPARVSIFSDSSIVVEVGGVEIGQGLWTKVRQTAAFGLNQLWEEGDSIDIAKIRVVQADTISLPNGGWTSGSTTSEGSCEAVRLACKVLVERLKPIKESLRHTNQQDVVTWESLVFAAKFGNVDLSAQAYFVSSPETFMYINYGAATSEVEIDVLTGETQILRTDIIYDCGKSMNPAVDIGQIEGAFAQGVGFFTTEEHVVDEHGRLFSDGTWTYKPPILDNLPRKFNVELLNSTVHKDRILSSKASGEPPLLLASSVHGAIRHAITAARRDLLKFTNGVRDSESLYFQLDSPATIDKVRTLCGLENIELYLQSVSTICRQGSV